jgi:cytochrome c-type biogenesis protein CcmF
MIPELGHFSLILALCLSVLLALVPMAGTLRGDRSWMLLARSLAAGQFVFVLAAFTLLAYSFLHDDFSVKIVANHSNTLLPDAYKFSAVWGNHEGSLLLWALILSFWTVAVAQFSRQLPLDMVARVLSVMGMIAVGFLCFSLLTSNPFERILPFAPVEGADLNPLLQDPGMVIHPPMLYFGYVGFSVAFAFAIAALSSGRLDAAWARWSRPWTNVAWAFLTLGIALGSWWAYYELGWGGWWFWDPVENASFMPWLAGTALMHSLAVTEKRGVFKSWTVLLAIFTFSLSLLGTFLVRSGVLTSVHSFAADPTRGLFILGFLAVVIGGSLLLYALRAPTVASRSSFSGLSREMFLLINNVVLLVAVLTVLFGTLFPLIMDALKLGKYSVGPPYFNAVFVPLMAILIVFMGIGPSTHWKQTRASYLRAQLLMAAVASVITALVFPFVYGDGFSIPVALAVCFAAWLVFSCAVSLLDKTRNAKSRLSGLRRLTRAYYGMLLGHIGLAVTVLGVCLSSQYSEEVDLRMASGESTQLAGYDFQFAGTRNVTGPNFVGTEGVLLVTKAGRAIAELHPQKRRYHAKRGQMMTEAAIDASLWRDLYVAMGEELSKDAWAIRLHYKPFVRWIWLGAIFMALGGVLGAADKRYRIRVKDTQAEQKAGAVA